MRKIFIRYIFLFVVLIFLGACSTKHAIEVAPIETRHVVEPIHIIIDINVKVDRALDDFFGDIDKAEEKLQGSGTK